MAKKNVGGLVYVCGEENVKRVELQPHVFSPDGIVYRREMRPVVVKGKEYHAVEFPAGEAGIGDGKVGAAYALACRMVKDGLVNVRIVSLGVIGHAQRYVEYVGTEENPDAVLEEFYGVEYTGDKGVIKARFTAKDVSAAYAILDNRKAAALKLAA